MCRMIIQNSAGNVLLVMGRSIILAVALAASACGGDPADGPIPAFNACDEETRADTYTAGLTRDGSEGLMRVVLTDAAPSPPDQGFNRWEIHVEDMNGQPVPGVQVDAKPWMPDHGHGSVPLMHRARQLDTNNEQRTLGPMNFFMPGLWTVTMKLTSSLGADEAVFAFCLEG